MTRMRATTATLGAARRRASGRSAASRLAGCVLLPEVIVTAPYSGTSVRVEWPSVQPYAAASQEHAAASSSTVHVQKRRHSDDDDSESEPDDEDEDDEDDLDSPPRKAKSKAKPKSAQQQPAYPAAQQPAGVPLEGQVSHC